MGITELEAEVTMAMEWMESQAVYFRELAGSPQLPIADKLRHSHKSDGFRESAHRLKSAIGCVRHT